MITIDNKFVLRRQYFWVSINPYIFATGLVKNLTSIVFKTDSMSSCISNYRCHLSFYMCLHLGHIPERSWESEIHTYVFMLWTPLTGTIALVIVSGNTPLPTPLPSCYSLDDYLETQLKAGHPCSSNPVTTHSDPFGHWKLGQPDLGTHSLMGHPILSLPTTPTTIPGRHAIP